MKIIRKIISRLFVFLSLFVLLSCGKEDADTYSYYENMEEITVSENQITLVLYENKALPYRWSYDTSVSNIVLVEEKSVAEEGFSLQAGEAKSYHIFIFECDTDCEGQIKLQLERVDDTKEVWQLRVYDVAFRNNQGSCVLAVEE